ncbi:MAG TPA: GWxTD domain-containing protein, partial [Thermoanaerobaculia bacterium]|nr:GWxTD domain-containing protein [Thermoanaerobaculia bacterium]
MKNLLAAVALFAFAGGALAVLSPEKAKWGEGPVQFLMTKDEAARWKALQNDADADAFMIVFWARRGGAPVLADQQGRWQYADEKFSVGKTPGSMTDRGKALALFGVPNKVLKGGGQGASTITAPGTGTGQHITGSYMDQQGDAGADSKNQAVQVWVYEGDLAQKVFGVPKAELRFADRFNNNEFKMETPRIDFAAARERAINAMIVRPDITTVADINKPKQPVLLPPPPAPAGVKTAAYAAAVADAKSGKAALSKGALLTAAEFVSPSGDYYAPVMLVVPKWAG